MFLRKYRNQSLHLYVFHDNDICDAFSLVYFKFYLELEPAFEIFEIFIATKINCSVKAL
jgi:hypothetical protein